MNSRKPPCPVGDLSLRETGEVHPAIVGNDDARHVDPAEVGEFEVVDAAPRSLGGDAARSCTYGGGEDARYWHLWLRMPIRNGHPPTIAGPRKSPTLSYIRIEYGSTCRQPLSDWIGIYMQ